MTNKFFLDSPSDYKAHETHTTQTRNAPRFVKKTFSQAYSRFVNLMKFLLPLAALALLFLVFLWPNLNSDDLKFQLGFATINFEIGGQPSMINPRYHGADEKNQRYSVTADLAKRIGKNQDSLSSEVLRLEMPKADIMMKDGTWLVLTAKTGVFLKKEQKLNLTGKVNLFHDSGFEVTTQKAQIDLENGAATGALPVEGHGPFGHLEGEGFKLLNKGKTIFFTGKSRLTIHPSARDSLK